MTVVGKVPTLPTLTPATFRRCFFCPTFAPEIDSRFRAHLDTFPPTQIHTFLVAGAAKMGCGFISRARSEWDESSDHSGLVKKGFPLIGIRCETSRFDSAKGSRALNFHPDFQPRIFTGFLRGAKSTKNFVPPIFS